MCSAFATTFKTERGKKFVREHDEDLNAQLVCSKLHRFYVTSFGARVNASYMLSCMTSSKFEYLKGTTESFILNCQNQVHLHKSLVNTNIF